jgi:hypothetical protein
MYFFDSSPTETRKLGVLKAYTSAVNFILLITEADKAFSFFSYMCAYHIRMFLTADCILLKVLRSSYKDDIDFDAGKKLCDQATVAASRMAVTNNDAAGKTGKMVAQLWHSNNMEILEEPPELLVKSRLGARLVLALFPSTVN